MAKVTDPLLSGTARGQVGNDLQFRLDRGTTHVWRPPARARKNRRAATAPQAAHRAYYAEALADWRRIPDSDRSSWNAKAQTASTQCSGWNLFLASRMAARTEQRWRYLLMNLGPSTNIEITPDGRAYTAELTGDGILTIQTPATDLQVSILYLTTFADNVELATPEGVTWMDGAPVALRPIPGQTLEVYIRATPTWVGISARAYY